MSEHAIPLVDISSFSTGESKQAIARQIAEACLQHGFFYITGHGVSKKLQEQLYEKSHQFFSLGEAEKMAISMDRGGKAWRGYFPLHGELTSGLPDRKEGLYFGTELGPGHPTVKAGVPLHGANLFPENPAGFSAVVLEYIGQVSLVGKTILQGVALSLGLKETYFEHHYTHDPLILFRIFHYPAQAADSEEWGVGEHTDYGLLTILLQDTVGGLQIKSNGKWVDAPPISDTFICNIGDMLERITGGLYKSTPHRVLNKAGKNRLSFPLFFDPGFDAPVRKIENISLPLITDDSSERWDKASVHEFSGTYGDYLLQKIGKVFPDLGKELL